uniref:Lipocalin n=1 Tax=Rhipicephalus zambeziensis TaxID=60191 RepID=A0A224YDF1_9ACAR
MFKPAVTLVLAVFLGVNGATTLDIYQAVNTTKETYVYSTLRPSNTNTCTYYRKPQILCTYGNCFYYFHYNETTRPSKTWWDYGEIQQPCRQSPYQNYSCLLRMDVSKYNITQVVEEPERKVLMSWHEKQGCGVYIVLVNNTQAGCELHARYKALKDNSSLETCENDFDKHCKVHTNTTHNMNSCINYMA